MEEHIFRIWIEIDSKFIMFTPEEATIDKTFINQFQQKTTITWTEGDKRIFESKVIDKRYKKPESIIKYLIRRYLK